MAEEKKVNAPEEIVLTDKQVVEEFRNVYNQMTQLINAHNFVANKVTALELEIKELKLELSAKKN